MSRLEQISAGIKGAFRIAQTTAVLAQTGMDWLMGERPPAPKLLRETFEKLGTTYIKLGQFIASSPSLFPDEYVEEFQLCLDKTSPVPFSIMRTGVSDRPTDPFSGKTGIGRFGVGARRQLAHRDAGAA